MSQTPVTESRVARAARSVLRWYSPRAFGAGLGDCNRAARTLLPRQPGLRVLDVGCGTGETTCYLTGALASSVVLGIEFDPDAARIAQQRGVACVRSDLSLGWPFVPGAFDVVISSQNIEHMHRTSFYVRQIWQALRPGGHALVLTENLAGWANIAALLGGYQAFSTTNIDGLSLGCPFIWHIDEPRDMDRRRELEEQGVVGAIGHVRVLAYQGLRDLFLTHGFQVVTMSSAGYFPFWGWPSRLLSRADPRHGNFLVLLARRP